MWVVGWARNQQPTTYNRLPTIPMQAIIFCGIQGAGKTTFYLERFFATHVRISMDMLRTRRREELLLKACIEGKTQFVVDNTNPTIVERAVYIAPARAAGFRIVGYYFAAKPTEAMERNARRAGAAQVPVPGLLGTYKRLQIPSLAEGFDELHYVRNTEGCGFVCEPWREDALPVVTDVAPPRGDT